MKLVQDCLVLSIHLIAVGVLILYPVNSFNEKGFEMRPILQIIGPSLCLILSGFLYAIRDTDLLQRIIRKKSSIRMIQVIGIIIVSFTIATIVF
jgi:hypothetical protein